MLVMYLLLLRKNIVFMRNKEIIEFKNLYIKDG